MLGIVIGVASIICVLSLVSGVAGAISRQFETLGGNAFSIRADTSIEDALRGRRNRLHLSDLTQLARGNIGLQYITPVAVVDGRLGAEVRSGSNVAAGMLLGTTAHFQDLRQTFPRTGRFLTETDETFRRRVVVLGEKIRRDLRLPSDPTGSYIQVNSEWFKIVGVMESRGEIFGISQDDYLLVPFSTALSMRDESNSPDLSIGFTIDDKDQVESIKARVSMLMRRAHGLKPGAVDDFIVDSADSLRKSFADTASTVTVVLSGIVGVSLLVGGVGVMNIMLVSVAERTREIGIMKAIGATRKFILTQFLLEAVVLTSFGGAMGVGLGLGAAWLISAIVPNFPEPTVSWVAIVGAPTFSGLIGVVFGILPASNAANMLPIDALRHE
jgi:putative ABC transport system permease protein